LFQSSGAKVKSKSIQTKSLVLTFFVSLPSQNYASQLKNTKWGGSFFSFLETPV